MSLYGGHPGAQARMDRALVLVRADACAVLSGLSTRRDECRAGA